MENVNIFRSARHVLSNLKRMFVLAWETDSRLMVGYYSTAAIASLASIVGAIILKYLIDNLIVVQNSSATTSITTVVVVVLAARYLVGFINSVSLGALNRVYFDYLFRYKLQNSINFRFYKKLAELDIAHLENSKVQDLIAKARDTMTWHPPDFLRAFSYFLGYIVSLTSAFIVLIPFGWWIGPVVIVINLPVLYLRAKFGSIQWSLYGSGAPQVRKLWYFTWLLSEREAIQEMRIFQSHESLLTKFKEIQSYLFELNSRPIQQYTQMLAIPAIFGTIVLLILAGFQLPAVLSGAMTVGSFALLINMIDALSNNSGAAVVSFGELYSHSLYVDHFFDVLSLPKIIVEKKQPIIFNKIVPPRIEFRNVSFNYPNGPEVLKNVSFVVEPGENVAFVGENGAGKSTIIKLLCRFYDVTGGVILINGVDIKNLSLANWYKFLGTLFQEFVHYHFTARENITLGKPSKKDFAAVEEAARNSGALEFIQKLPKGFDTLLGREFENGEEVSSGQWQKLAIARAFYEEAPVLILDEPTSAIDAEAEFEIFTNLEKVYKNKTLILVSHRFSTVRNASKILVVQNGEIIEQGAHRDLLKLDGKYARMFNVQARGYQ